MKKEQNIPIFSGEDIINYEKGDTCFRNRNIILMQYGIKERCGRLEKIEESAVMGIGNQNDNIIIGAKSLTDV